MKNLGEFFLKNKIANELSLSPETLAVDALQVAFKHKMRPLLVVSQNRLVGVFSAIEYLQSLFMNESSSTLHIVGDYMKSVVPCFSDNMSFEDCLTLMRKNSYSYVAVTQNQKMLGLLDTEQVIEGMVDGKDFLIKQLTHYITGSPLTENVEDQQLEGEVLNEFYLPIESFEISYEKAA